MSDDLIIAPVNPHSAAVAALLQQADDYLLSRYPPELCFLEDAEALDQPHITLLGAHVGDELMGMGAAKVIATENSEDGYGEIKRLFVRAEARRRNLGKRLLQALESHLLHNGMRVVRLEAGTEQPEALRLYDKLGYTRRGPFGDYPDNPMSVFLEKRLAS